MNVLLSLYKIKSKIMKQLFFSTLTYIRKPSNKHRVCCYLECFLLLFEIFSLFPSMPHFVAQFQRMAHYATVSASIYVRDIYIYTYICIYSFIHIARHFDTIQIDSETPDCVINLIHTD